MQVKEMARAAADSVRQLSDTAARDRFLLGVAGLLLQRQDEIMAANARDVARARDAGMDGPRIDRLTLTDRIFKEMAAGCRFLAGEPDPVGHLEAQWKRPNGLLVGRMRIPLGVIAMIYEARPNVTVDAAVLCVKAGNAVILRGGSEAASTNGALVKILQEALECAGLPSAAVQLLGGGHEAVHELVRLDELVDLVIPRGGEGLIRQVCAIATVPVLKHYKGVCHAYVDQGADLSQALDIIENSKMQRPGVCNALECLLVHEAEASALLPQLAGRLPGVEFRADPAALAILQPHCVAGQAVRPLQPEDCGQEFHALILAVLVVPDLDAAMTYIARHGSHHTDIICTRDYGRGMRFVNEVDSSMVAINASTRFNDGGQLGLGAEIGISTSKLHAYGPMGLRELTTTKFVVLGNGQIRE